METPKKRFFIFRWIDKLTDIGGAIAAFFLGVIACIITYEVVMRKFFNSPTSWVGETSVYMWMVVGLLGAAFALKNDSHFGITTFIDQLSAKNRSRIQIVTKCMGLIYSIIFIFKGYEMAVTSYELEDISSGLMAMPLWIPCMMVPIGGLLLSLQFINKIAEEFSD